MGTVAVVKIFFALYCLFAFLLSLILLYVVKALSRNGLKKIAKVVRLVNWVLILPIVLVVISWLYATYIEPNWLEVKQLVIVSDKFDPKLKDLTIVHLTDLHVEHFGFREKKLIQIVNSMHPDIILLGGDFVNKKSGILPCAQLLTQLKASKSIIAIMGNIDYYYFRKEVKVMLEELKIPCLENEAVKIEFGGKNPLWIVGISYYREQPEYIEQAFSRIPLRDTKVMLVHNPDIVDMPIVETLEPDLILAGHTHGGQFGIAFIRKLSDYAERSAYMAGLFKPHGLNLYVNRGIGMKSRNIRFFCRPEIVVVRLKKNE